MTLIRFKKHFALCYAQTLIKLRKILLIIGLKIVSRMGTILLGQRTFVVSEIEVIFH